MSENETEIGNESLNESTANEASPESELPVIRNASDIQKELDKEMSLPEEKTEVEKEIEKYTPNYKFKVLDQEKEIDEYFRSFIKSKEDEEKFKDVFTKAYGLDVVKGNLNKTREELAREQFEKTKVTNTVQELYKHVQNGNMEDFFEAWGLNDEKIFQYAMKRLKLMENPELKAQYDVATQQRRASHQMEQEKEMLMRQNQEILSKQYEMEFQYNMDRPEVVSFAQKFDKLPGRKEGDFATEVLKHGYFTFQTQGHDIPISQAINETIRSYQGFIGNSQQEVKPRLEGKVLTQSQVSKTIPNIGSSSESPTKKKVRSIEDLEQIAKHEIEASR